MLLRQIQAFSLPGHRVRKMRRGGDPQGCAPGSDGPHRPGRPGHPYLVFQRSPLPVGVSAGHVPQKPGDDHLLCGLRDHGSGRRQTDGGSARPGGADAGRVGNCGGGVGGVAVGAAVPVGEAGGADGGGGGQAGGGGHRAPRGGAGNQGSGGESGEGTRVDQGEFCGISRVASQRSGGAGGFVEGDARTLLGLLRWGNGGGGGEEIAVQGGFGRRDGGVAGRFAIIVGATETALRATCEGGEALLGGQAFAGEHDYRGGSGHPA